MYVLIDDHIYLGILKWIANEVPQFWTSLQLQWVRIKLSTQDELETQTFLLLSVKFEPVNFYVRGRQLDQTSIWVCIGYNDSQINIEE